MKAITIFATLMFTLTTIVSAQGMNVETGAPVNVNAGAGQRANATATSASVNARNNAQTTNDDSADESESTVESTRAGRDTGARAVSEAGVSLKAREVRGWSQSDKSEFLLSVKAHAQLQSGQDLENFAKGVLARDENVESVEASDDNVEVKYRLPAKFLGIFGSQLSAVTNVTFDQNGGGPKEVNVRFPWYRMFYSLDSEIQTTVLQGAVESALESDAELDVNTNVHARNGRVVQLLSDILKGIRANADADVSTGSATN
jgi:hypothetical protein